MCSALPSFDEIFLAERYCPGFLSIFDFHSKAAGAISSFCTFSRVSFFHRDHRTDEVILSPRVRLFLR